ncbi:hypothetical protein PFISCL1PPCAC_3518, partial [Pristionchus fissidentatus]
SVQMLLISLLSLISSTSSLKFLAYSPQFAKSHVNFIGKISDTLVDAGHEVVMLSEVFDSGLGGPGTKKARVIEIPQTAKARKVEQFFSTEAASNFWNDVSLYESLKGWGSTQSHYAEQCRDEILQPQLLDRLRAEKFDAAYTESFHFCAPVLFHFLGIDKFAITDSVALNDGWFFYSQTPSNPAYVPTMMGSIAGDEMNFFERVYNTYVYSLVSRFYVTNSGVFNDAMKNNFPDLPNVQDLMGRNSLLFVNSEPLVDFPRPSSARVIDIGGIVVSGKHQPLDEEWSAILDLRPTTIFISFGTVAKAYLMPEQYKKTIVDVVKRFPDVTFIWKYEKPEHNISAGIDNLIESTWVPQRDLLHDSRLSAFITHCGQGSTTESIDAGLPLIVIPVLADQYRNAHQLVKNGIGLMLEKPQLKTIEPLERAVKEILEDQSYRKRAVEVREMIKDRPFSMDKIFVRNMEFLAKHGPLRQLDHYGRHLNFFQYYLIDVIAAVILGTIIVVSISVFIAFKILSFSRHRIVIKRKMD